jgi:hypothetical protein
MIITYLIGNGFDINLGLKTKTQEFLDYYVNECKSDKKAVKLLKDDIYNDKGLKQWLNLELRLGSFTEKLDDPREMLIAYDDMASCL